MEKFVWALIVWILAATTVVHAEQQRVGIFVGVNVYPKPGFDRLNYAERDVEQVAKEFEQLGFRTVVLKGSLPKGNPLRATKDNIVQQIQTLMTPLDGDDLCVVMLSGHGLQFKPDGKASEDAFFCPVDAVKSEPDTLLSLSYVIDTLLDPHVGQKLLLVDACRDAPKPGLGQKGIQGSDKISLPSQTSVFFSCSAREQSFETEKLGGGSGTFAYCLLDGLRNSADSRNPLTWTTLVAHVENKFESDEVRRVTLAQHPVHAGNVGRVVLGRATQAREIISSSTGMKLLLIRGGEFLMGSPETDKDALEVEKPSHRVRISRDFYLGQTEVTQGQWKSVMGTEPWKGKDYVREGSNYPATYVSWDDAMEFVMGLNGKEGTTKYRLPTEAEWEYACRGGTETTYSFGNDAKRLSEYGWWDGNAWSVGEKYAHEVKTRKGNPFELYDMHGNVWEWCADYYDEKYYGKSSGVSVDPVKDPVKGTESADRVLRGGSWCSSAPDSRSANRNGLSPDFRYSFIGFRIARTQ